MTQQAPQTERPTVLVVDDEVAIVKVLRDFLEAEGFGVLVAQDGAAALVVLARESVDCLLLDIMMPGADGFDVCRQIRAGATIFRNGHAGSWMQSSRQAVILEGGRQLGTVEVFVPVRANPLVPASVLLALALALLVVGWQIGRGIVRPLEAMSRAARRIAEGDLDFALPASPVTEIAEVRAAFEVMRAGLQDSIEQQAALEEERQLFIGAIAHDLRTPLFTLRAYLRGLQKGIAATPEKVREYVDECAAVAAGDPARAGRAR